MSRYDIARLRKEKGMSQGELASQLQMTQSFLSAIENGKSPLPVEKIEKLCEIFNIHSLDHYAVSKKGENETRSLDELTDSDLFNQLLNRFHRQAHNAADEHHHHSHHEHIDTLRHRVSDLFETNKQLQNRIESLLERIDSLLRRNDALAEENRRLRSKLERD